jgi:hypothetical protein
MNGDNQTTSSWIIRHNDITLIALIQDSSTVSRWLDHASPKLTLAIASRGDRHVFLYDLTGRNVDSWYGAPCHVVYLLFLVSAPCLIRAVSLCRLPLFGELTTEAQYT